MLLYAFLQIKYNLIFVGQTQAKWIARPHKLSIDISNLCYKSLIPIHQLELKLTVHINNSVL